MGYGNRFRRLFPAAYEPVEPALQDEENKFPPLYDVERRKLGMAVASDGVNAAVDAPGSQGYMVKMLNYDAIKKWCKYIMPKMGYQGIYVFNDSHQAAQYKDGTEADINYGQSGVYGGPCANLGFKAPPEGGYAQQLVEQVKAFRENNTAWIPVLTKTRNNGTRAYMRSKVYLMREPRKVARNFKRKITRQEGNWKDQVKTAWTNAKKEAKRLRKTTVTEDGRVVSVSNPCSRRQESRGQRATVSVRVPTGQRRQNVSMRMILSRRLDTESSAGVSTIIDDHSRHADEKFVRLFRWRLATPEGVSTWHWKFPMVCVYTTSTKVWCTLL